MDNKTIRGWMISEANYLTTGSQVIRLFIKAQYVDLLLNSGGDIQRT